jgi:stearoyl-CoA desaturase (delta-9 desaturase)
MDNKTMKSENPSQPDSKPERLRERIIKAVQEQENVTLLESTPLVLMHLLALSVFWVGFSWPAFWGLVITYSYRVFVLTAAYHRYFSHKSYKTSRPFQFVLAFLGTSAGQCGPLWWAAHHRHHHEYSDKPEDVHSPTLKGIFWAHMGWIMCRKYATTELRRVQDFAKYPEIRFLDRWHVIGPLALLAGCYGVGVFLKSRGFDTSGGQMVAWAFCLSTVMVYHATFCINSLTHLWGSRRYPTTDTSRNNLFTALVTFGEGWHNNHHWYPYATRQGFFWWELDLTYYILKLLSRVGLVWDLREPPDKVRYPSQHHA